MQMTNLQGDLEDLTDLPVQIDRDYNNILPTARFNYDFSNSKHLSLDYETSVQEPTIQQLQPVLDNSDPMNLYVGNPRLRPAYSQTWRLHFNTFNPMNFISFFAFANVDYITNAITTARSVDQNTLVAASTPVNVDNNMNMTGNATVSFPINKIKSRFSVGANFRNTRTINLLNDAASTIDQQTAGGTMRYNYRYKEILDVNLSARLERQLTDYEFNGTDQIFLNNVYTADANLTFLKNYQLSPNFEYLAYESVTNHSRRTIPLLNLAVSRYMLKNKSGELKFSVTNLLDKALGVNQTANSNYYERQVTNSLGRYYMVTFTYALNKHLNPMGGMRRGGGGMRIIRGG
jgi:hypothetical protein